MSDESQRKTDSEYRLHELREGARRFADFGRGWAAQAVVEPAQRTANQPDEATATPAPISAPLLTPDNWEGWLAKREEINAQEKADFNRKYNYAP